LETLKKQVKNKSDSPLYVFFNHTAQSIYIEIINRVIVACLWSLYLCIQHALYSEWLWNKLSFYQGGTKALCIKHLHFITFVQCAFKCQNSRVLLGTMFIPRRAKTQHHMLFVSIIEHLSL